jgi:homoserine dehydrogenase
MTEQQGNQDAGRPQLCVLKFGSSVLAEEGDYPAVALEIYRHVRDGEKVIAVVSALAGQTDALLDQAERLGGGDHDALAARLARVGELHSAALMALAVSRMGMRACTLDPNEMGLRAEGEPLDSNLCDLDSDYVWGKLADHDVVVVPGFTAMHDQYGVVTLGRGGTDLSAVFFAARLDAHRVRLIKDVDGVYAEDPAANPNAQRFAQLDYARATQASAGLIQEKAIRAAESEDVLIEVAALAQAGETAIAHLPVKLAQRPRKPRLRVALLGCGAVGAGVLAHLEHWKALFELNPVLVRHPMRYSEKGNFTSELDHALAGEVDILIELLGGPDYSAEIMGKALRSGTHVVTANKAAVAKHYDELRSAASAGGTLLQYSAAVGGGTPVVERVRQIDGRLSAIEGVMNGTSNFLLDRLHEGWTFDEALARARELGFAEEDPSGDVDGHDAADKLSLLIREAFGTAMSPAGIPKQSLREVDRKALLEARAKGQVLKQVARCSLVDGNVEASVTLEYLPPSHPLAAARNEDNAFVLQEKDGTRHCLHAKGAGRWPTAASVFSDVMDIYRAIAAHEADAPSIAPMRLSA